jgi:hypothetical protein
MATETIIRGLRMISRLAVTIDTASQHKIVIHLSNRLPSCRERIMASITYILTGDVSSGFTTGIGPVVAGQTIAAKGAVVHDYNI